MKKYILIFLCLMMVSGSFAQIKDFKFKFYGQIRTDLYYNSRANYFICIRKIKYVTKTGMT